MRWKLTNRTCRSDGDDMEKKPYFALYKGEDIITHGNLMFIHEQTNRSIRQLLKFRFKNRENYKLILVDEIEED